MRRASPRAARAPPGPAWKVPSPAPCSRTSVHFWTWGACHVTGPEHSREMASREDSGVLCASSFLRETAPVHPQHHEYHHRNRTHVVAAKPRCLSQEQSGAHPGLGCFPGGRKRQPFLSKRPFPPPPPPSPCHRPPPPATAPPHPSPPLPGTQNRFLGPLAAPCCWFAELRTLLCSWPSSLQPRSQPSGFALVFWNLGDPQIPSAGRFSVALHREIHSCVFVHLTRTDTGMC